MNYKSFNLGDWIGHISGVIEDETTLDGNEMRDLVEFLSTLEQKPRKGHWINTANPCMSDNIVCSECGYNSIADYKFCPNCGSRNEVEE